MKPVLAMVALVVCLGLGGARAQSPENPEFEVASVRLNSEPGPANNWQVSGRRFMFNKSQVIQLIRLAYGDFQLRIEGAPDWVNDRYDVFANAPADIAFGDPALSQMMRALLVERFRLEARLESRETPIYALVMARPDRRFGPGLGDPISDCPLSTGTVARGPAACGPGTDNGVIRFGNLPMSSLALFLSRMPTVGRRVVDETGLDGGLRVNLQFEAGLLSPDQAPTGLPSIFTALEEQLGLKLESRQGTTQVLVIERLERPTPN